MPPLSRVRLRESDLPSRRLKAPSRLQALFGSGGILGTSHRYGDNECLYLFHAQNSHRVAKKLPETKKTS